MWDLHQLDLMADPDITKQKHILLKDGDFDGEPHWSGWKHFWI